MTRRGSAPRTYSYREMRRLNAMGRRDLEEAGDYWRPRTVADCASIPATCPACGRWHAGTSPGDACPDCGAALVFRCPYAGCEFHLYLEVRYNGTLKISRPDMGPEEMDEPCLLRAIARAGAIEIEALRGRPWYGQQVAEDDVHMRLAAIGRLLNVTKHAVALVELRALAKLRDAAASMGRLDATGLSAYAATLRAVDAEDAGAYPAPMGARTAEALRRAGEEIDGEWTVAIDRIRRAA